MQGIGLLCNVSMRARWITATGLRGAADVDGNGRITYAEMTVFIHIANRPVVNDLYCPKVFSSAPRVDKTKEKPCSRS